MIRLLGRVDTATEHGKEESRRRGSPAAHLSSSRVDWPAQPSLDLAQNYFSRISWIVSIVLLPPLLGWVFGRRLWRVRALTRNLHASPRPWVCLATDEAVRHEFT